ncbi:hypothetical protein [Vibrio campbellii]|uniref:hypothetical protein n=1 Tax=Vibrio campbellii TaxID=680 RepID=UPI0005EF4CF0|nr:hypothetical protein [Vibrio campbellii]
MQVEIKYLSSMTDEQQEKVSNPELYAEVATYSDPEANLSKFFSKKIEGIKVTGGGVSFEYNSANTELYCVASYMVCPEPSSQQLSILVELSTQQIDCGYYGEDGWFVDTSFGSFYIQLVDPEQRTKPPFSINVY